MKQNSKLPSLTMAESTDIYLHPCETHANNRNLKNGLKVKSGFAKPAIEKIVLDKLLVKIVATDYLYNVFHQK